MSVASAPVHVSSHLHLLLNAGSEAGINTLKMAAQLDTETEMSGEVRRAKVSAHTIHTTLPWVAC